MTEEGGGGGGPEGSLWEVYARGARLGGMLGANRD